MQDLTKKEKKMARDIFSISIEKEFGGHYKIHN